MGSPAGLREAASAAAGPSSGLKVQFSSSSRFFFSASAASLARASSWLSAYSLRKEVDVKGDGWIR
jgi:hypothetical protein